MTLRDNLELLGWIMLCMIASLIAVALVAAVYGLIFGAIGAFSYVTYQWLTLLLP